MFCKYCGKEINNDSVFCRYCGRQVDESIKISEIKSNIDESQLLPTVPAEDNPSIKIEIVKKGTIKKSTIANEVIANMKMIGNALIVTVLFMIGFYAYHTQDTKPMDDNSYFGESRYDRTLNGEWEFSWELHYYKTISATLPYSEWSDLHKKLGAPPFDFSRSSINVNYEPKTALELAGKDARAKHIPENVQESIKKISQEVAQKDIEDFKETITLQRKSSFEVERNLILKWCIITSLCIFIIGRYLIIFSKWISTNKTENK